MDQKVETTTPTTSACTAITSKELVTVSNIRMVGSPLPEIYPASDRWRSLRFDAIS